MDDSDKTLSGRVNNGESGTLSSDLFLCETHATDGRCLRARNVVLLSQP